jgi:LPS sulfotransferase NodH
MICTATRSASSMLAATGVAGTPASYFYDPSVAGWLAGLGLGTDARATEKAHLQAVMNEVLRWGRAGIAKFGLRQQALGQAFLCEKLAVLALDQTTDAKRIRASVDALTALDQGWTDWFAQKGITPIRLPCAGVSTSPQQTLRLVLENRGLAPERADGVTLGTRKLADATNQTWVARFCSEFDQ